MKVCKDIEHTICNYAVVILSVIVTLNGIVT